MNEFYSVWSDNLENDEAQAKRMASARKSALTPIQINHTELSGIFSGKHGEYVTTIANCQCGDFISRRKPCKHIFRLAHELNLLDLGTVQSDPNAIVEPDYIQAERNRQDIESAIDSYDPNSYPEMLDLLTHIRRYNRISVLDMAIDYLSSFVNTPSAVSGLTFVITGTFTRFTRVEVDEYLQANGATVSSSVSKRTDYVIYGENAVIKKLAKAAELEIPTLSEHEFMDKFYI